MFCPIISNDCTGKSCPLHKDHYAEDCDLYALKKLPEIVKVQKALNDNMYILLHKLDDLTDAINALVNKLGNQ